VTISTSYAGPISISRTEVNRIEGSDIAKTAAAPKSALVSGEVAMDGKDVAVDPEAVEMEDKKEWSGSVNLAMKLEGGRTNEDREIDGDF